VEASVVNYQDLNQRAVGAEKLSAVRIIIWQGQIRELEKLILLNYPNNWKSYVKRKGYKY